MRITTYFLLLLLLTGCSGYEVRDEQVYWTYWNEGTGNGERELNADQNIQNSRA